MPPKRKAASAAAENDPPQPRRLTRSTATTTVEAPAELPPAKRTRRSTKTDDASSTTAHASKVQDVSATTKSNGRASRAAARARKADADAEDPPAPETSVPKKRGGRGKKVQKEEEAESHPEEPAPPPKPLSPARENVKHETRKRTRSTKTQETATVEPEPQSNEAESSRPKRARRTAGSAATHAASKRLTRDAIDNESQPTTEQASPSTVQGRMKRKGAAPSTVPKAAPPKVSSPVKKKILPVSRTKTPEEHGEESSDDELLLTSENRPTTPTPTRPTGSRLGTPRMVMEAVEICTPKHLLAATKRNLGSPAPRGPTHTATLGTPRLPPAAPGSPNKRAFPLPPSSALRQRKLRTPSPEPAPPHPASLSRTARKAVLTSPTRRQRHQGSQRAEDGLPRDLPDHLLLLLEHQKRAILKSLQQPPEIDELEVYGEDYPPTNTHAYEQLTDLLTGSVVRGEGNSCLLIGPSGSGKTQMVERAIAALPTKPIVVRLSGYAQHNDRLAIREIAWQLAQQTGTSFLPDESDDEDEDVSAEVPAPVEQEPSAETQEEEDGDDDENPFVEHAPAAPSSTVAPIITLPPPSHLLALISMIPTLPRPTVIVLDGFDLFASHARQALLYCLLDAAQACRTGTGAGSGMAVVGVTARVDTINILEKRVKSRFSGRMIRTACPTRLDHWVALAKATLGTSLGEEDAENADEWAEIWDKAVTLFLEDARVVEAFREVYALTRDYQIFRRIMTCLTLELTDTSPYPTLKVLKAAISRQRCPARYPPLNTLPYPAICLLIAQVHAQTSGHDVFTFEMLYDAFKSQVRTSHAAPVQVQGGGVGMVRCSREVLFSAFERMVDLRIFLPAAAPAATIAKEFALHRSAVDRLTVKKAVDQMGQLSLKRWLMKA